MGRTVKVEGNIAATTTSDHIAHTVGPDLRLKGQTVVQRKNWIETKHLSKDRTTNTKFDGGWVWKSDTLCGDPPMSNDMPADKLPGKNNGLLVNSYAEAQEGEGAQTVYVEGLKVIRWDDKTHQNKRNSKGKIINAEDLAAYLAEPLEPDPAPPPPPPVVRTTTTDPNAGNQGTTTPQGDKKAAPRATTQGTDPTKDCTVVSVTTSRSGGAAQSPAPSSDQPGWLWVKDSTRVNVKVVGEKCCGEHPIVTFGGEKKKGSDVTFNPSNVFRVAERSVLNMLVPGSGTLPPRPVQTAITVQSCKKQFNRNVMVMGREVTKVTIGGGGSESGGVKSLLGKVPIPLPTTKFEFFSGSLEFELKWDEESNWEGALALEVSGNLTIIKVAIPLYRIPLFSFLGPAAAALQTVLEKVAKKLGADIEAGLYIEFVGELAVKGALTLKMINGKRFAFGGGEVTGEGTLKVGGRVTLKCTESFEATGAIYGGVTFKGLLLRARFPLVTMKLSCKFFVKTNITAKVEVGWFDIEFSKEYTLAESREFQLGTVDFFTFGVVIPVGYTGP